MDSSYESSDILGSNTLPVRSQPPAKWSGFSKTAFFLALLLAAYVGAVRAWDALLKWREKSYRLSMRRQHGIPDNDHRPFNVAYAAVLRARREEEVANNRVHRVDVDELYAEADRRAAPVESDIRQRNPYRDSEPAWPNSGAINGLPGRFNPLAPDSRYVASSSGLPPSSSYTPNFAERYKPNPTPAPHVVRFADEIQATGSSRRGSLNNMNINSSPRKQQKRALEEYDVESDVPENPKKTRVEGDEFIDGDEDAEWLQQKRGEKRVMREDDFEEGDEGASPPGRRVRGKRARKFSHEQEDVFMASDENADDDMDVDDEEYRESRAAIARGKKRDAGSSFGGEEEAEGSEQAQKTKRKRRTRKSDGVAQVPSRGQKRDRDVDEEGSDAEAPGTPARSTRKNKKRGKKSKEVRDEDEEGSVEESSVSKGKGRPIGDQWESNGGLYKIGPNGQRLRQALVKKAARRFTMPVDSQHPDRNANLEVCIETWLTEEEYKDFKNRHLLAWQDSPKGTQEPESMPSTPAAAAEVPSTPTPAVAKGKNLLWDSPASPFPVFAPSPAADKEQLRPRAHFRQSIATDVGMRVNPFDKANALHVGADLASKTGLRNGRRVVAVRETGTNANGLADSTNSNAAPPLRRTFSKWEKQDLEAKAMMKMREANQAKVKERELKERLEREKKERDAAAAAPIPTISLTAPSIEPPKPPAISFAPPTPAPDAAPSSSAPSFTLGGPTAAPSQPQKTVSFAPTPDKPQPPNLFTPVAPSGGGATPSSSIPNPFAKPAAPQSTPAPAAASSNPFAPTPSAAPASNPFAPSSSGPTAPSNNNAAATSKPSFSFAPPAAPGSNAQTKTSIFAPSAGTAARPPASAPAASNNNTSGAPSFSFAPPAAQQQQQQNAGQTQSGGAGSLLARMGGTPAPASSNNTNADPKPAEAASPAPTFSFKPTEKPSPFGVPQQQAAKPTDSAFSFKPAGTPAASAFAPPPQQQQQQQQPAAGTPKFTFASTKPAGPSTTSSSLTGALGTAEAKPGPTPTQGGSAFSFAKPAAPAPERQQTQVQTPSFSFNPAGASGSGFGGVTAPTPTPVPAATEGEKKPSGFGFNFGGGGAGGATSSAFGAGSAFGGGAGNNGAAAAPTSAFGGGAAKPQGAFGGFGGVAKPAEEAPKTTASAFGTTAATTNPTPAPAFSFGFGNGSNNAASTTPAASPAAAPSNPFGVKPSAFGSSTTPAGSPFGGPSPFGAKPAAGSTFGAPSPFGTPATTGGPSAFGNAGAATPSAFGFGAAQK